MVLKELDQDSGLPLVKEGRKKRLYRIPDQYGKLAQDFRAEATWCPGYLIWEHALLSRIMCWKCGRDLWGWRPAINQYGHRVVFKREPQPDVQAVWFKPYEHATSTLFYLHWKPVDQVVTGTQPDGSMAWPYYT